MVCTYCGSKTAILNSRIQRRANNTWRRRRCQACRRIFTTLEQVDYEKSWVVQYANGKPRSFLQDKLLISVFKSLQHRPNALSDALGITATVMARLTTYHFDSDITATVIATFTHQALQRFDKAAATMYAAYHADVL